MSGPLVVAIGGGHGLAVTLRAVQPWAGHVTAVVSTADDGGSTGRLRESWDVPALGDVRRCLTTLARPDDVWTRVLERRFDAGELARKDDVDASVRRARSVAWPVTVPLALKVRSSHVPVRFDPSAASFALNSILLERLAQRRTMLSRLASSAVA